MVEDLGSANGTRLNGQLLQSPMPFPPGGQILIGTTRITFSGTAQFPETQTNHPSDSDALHHDAGPLPTEEGSTMMMPGHTHADTEATMLVSRPISLHKTDGMPPAVTGARTDTGDDEDAETVLRSDDGTGGTEVLEDEDAATVLRRDDGTGGTEVLEDEDAATIVHGGGGTEILDDSEAGTIMGNDGATLMGGDDATALESAAFGADEAATALATRQSAAITGGDAATLLDDASATVTFSASGKTTATAGQVVTVDAAEFLESSDVEATMVGGGAAMAMALTSYQLHLRQCVQSAMETEFLQGLLKHNFIDTVQLTRLLQRAQESGSSFFRQLSEESAIPAKPEMYIWIAEFFNMELINDEERLNTQALSTDWLNYAQALDRGVVMLTSEEANRGRYGSLDPFDLTYHDWIERCLGKSASRVLIPFELFQPVISRLKNRPEDEAEAVMTIDFSQEDEQKIREHTTDVDVPQVVNYFLHSAYIQKASDIHIEPTEERLVVRNRVDGILHEEISLPRSYHPEVVSRLKIMSGMDVAEKRRPQDGRFGVTLRNNPLDVRVSSYPTVFGEKFVLRLLDKNALRPSIDSLGLMPRDLQLLKEKIHAPYGLIMISGPTGSGKTTTLYSCLASMDKTSKNILTVEDPVEYRLKGVHQMQVNHKIGLTFASGLRTILRQDPDVIMVGEIRDNETASMAVQASLTGHVVFSTIHTNDAVGVITRMLDMDIEPFLVATSLSMAIAQRLVRKICIHCVMPISGHEVLTTLEEEGVSRGRLEALGIDVDADLDYVQGVGCNRCRNTGYQGRQAVFEIFEMTEEARALIMNRDVDASALKDLSKKKGMTSLIAHGMKLVEEEVTTVREVIRVLGEEN
jgi:type II secretory ATPase GspE/PulE/Tfp pilus assembly ATPase PilB-like protein